MQPETPEGAVDMRKQPRKDDVCFSADLSPRYIGLFNSTISALDKVNGMLPEGMPDAVRERLVEEIKKRGMDVTKNEMTVLVSAVSADGTRQETYMGEYIEIGGEIKTRRVALVANHAEHGHDGDAAILNDKLNVIYMHTRPEWKGTRGELFEAEAATYAEMVEKLKAAGKWQIFMTTFPNSVDPETVAAKREVELHEIESKYGPKAVEELVASIESKKKKGE